MEFLTYILKLLELIGVYKEKKLSVVFKNDNIQYQFFRIYLINHTRNDINYKINMKVELNDKLLRDRHIDDGILIPNEKEKEIYLDNISYILHDNLVDENLSDPKDRTNPESGKCYPLIFTVTGIIKYRLLWTNKNNKNKSVWISEPPLWRFKQIE